MQAIVDLHDLSEGKVGFHQKIIQIASLQMRDWTDKEGGKRRSAEIVADSVYFGDSKAKEGQEPPASTGGPVEAAGGDTNSPVARQATMSMKSVVRSPVALSL